MANDRLYLVCMKCGEGHMLYKYYPSRGYTPEKLADAQSDFVAHHLQECHLWFEMDLGKKGEINTLFRLGTEHDLNPATGKPP